MILYGVPLPEFEPDVFQLARAGKAVLFVKTQAVFVFGRYERDQVFDAGSAGVPFERGKQLTADAPCKEIPYRRTAIRRP